MHPKKSFEIDDVFRIIFQHVLNSAGLIKPVLLVTPDVQLYIYTRIYCFIVGVPWL